MTTYLFLLRQRRDLLDDARARPAAKCGAHGPGIDAAERARRCVCQAEYDRQGEPVAPECGLKGVSASTLEAALLHVAEAWPEWEVVEAREYSASTYRTRASEVRP